MKMIYDLAEQISYCNSWSDEIYVDRSFAQHKFWIFLGVSYSYSGHQAQFEQWFDVNLNHTHEKPYAAEQDLF